MKRVLPLEQVMPQLELLYAVGPHWIHRTAAVAAAGDACGGAVAGIARRLAHGFERTGGPP